MNGNITLNTYYGIFSVYKVLLLSQAIVVILSSLVKLHANFSTCALRSTIVEPNAQSWVGKICQS